MAVRLSADVRDAMLDALGGAVDAGSGAATIKVYTGTQPANADTAPSGTLLVSFTCHDPAFGASSGGVLTLDADPYLTGTAVADGTAGWARVADSDGIAIFDGSVAVSGGDFTINASTITSGATVSVMAGTLTLLGA